MRDIAVVLAGGFGQRSGDATPKQFLKLAGKKVIGHTINVFQNHPLMDEIVVASNPNYMQEVENILVKNRHSKMKRILKEGRECYHSSLATINTYGEEVNMTFHDAACPSINNRIVAGCINALKTYNAADATIKTTDTVIQVSVGDHITGIPACEYLRNGQTPQAFKRSTIKRAYELILKDLDFRATGDCGVVYRYLPKEFVYVAKSEQSNMKLTYKEDMLLLGKLFQPKSIAQQNETVTSKTIAALPSSVTIVFGGSCGIGFDIIHICRQYGVHIYSFSHSENRVDASDSTLVADTPRIVMDKEGRVDAVVNTAGVLNREPLATMTHEEICKSTHVSYLGAAIVVRGSYPYLKMNRGALLLFIFSSYTKGRQLYSLYSSSKAAIVNFVQALSEKWQDSDIRINCISPGRTKIPVRERDFDIEPEDTLLKSSVVTSVSVNTIFSSLTGEMVDVKKRP